MNNKIEHKTIEAWVQQAQSGDESAFEKIFEHFFDTTFRFVSRKVNPNEVEDITSEVWLKIVKSIKKYTNTSAGSFSAWVFRIARNTIIDYYRTKKEFLSLENENDGLALIDTIPADASLMPNTILNQKYEHARIQKWIHTLPAKQKEVIELRFIEDLSHQEISQILGKSPGNIRVIQSRAIKTLKDSITD
jgi:RNA polymerase sigma-70 factor (ECF subfamily)